MPTTSPHRLDFKTWHTLAVCFDRDPLLYLGLWVVLRCRGMNVAWLMDVMSRLAMATVTICVIFLLWPGSDE